MDFDLFPAPFGLAPRTVSQDESGQRRNRALMSNVHGMEAQRRGRTAFMRFAAGKTDLAAAAIPDILSDVMPNEETVPR